jgi:hypothetical protein
MADDIDRFAISENQNIFIEGLDKLSGAMRIDLPVG